MLTLVRHVWQLSIETSALKSSGLGKIVYFYTKCKRVEPYIARMANQLVSDWMRPIIRRSKAFVDKDTSLTGTTASYEAHRPRGDKARRPLNPNVGARQKAEGSQGSGGGAVARRHARIPEQLTQSFKVAPAADPRERPERSGGGVGQSIGAGSGGAKMRSYKKKLVAGQQASRRV
jgi:transcription factor SPN1